LHSDVNSKFAVFFKKKNSLGPEMLQNLQTIFSDLEILLQNRSCDRQVNYD